MKLNQDFWRRDFEQGIVLVNSTEKQQNIFLIMKNLKKLMVLRIEELIMVQKLILFKLIQKMD